jgi:hypothetical protein
MIITVLLAVVSAKLAQNETCYENGKVWTPERQGKFPLISFKPDSNTPINLYDHFLTDLAHSGFIVTTGCLSEAKNTSNQIDWSSKIGLLGHGTGADATYRESSKVGKEIGAAVVISPSLMPHV